ncbi:MAG TPA: hypothetical protein VJO53_01780 [Candidatus Acidoferrales bacterium]|nr:hypothetical protein [Candidatus Acidoferrales bacterium]
MGLLDSTEEHPESKLRRYLITALAFIVLLAGTLWYLLRYHTEKVTVHHFMTALVAGDMQRAYQIWQPSPSYTMKDFLDDWGPTGFYGPVKSYTVERPEHIKDGPAAAVTVDVSPYETYPRDDPAKEVRTKKVVLWVQFKDQSISFPPE